MTRLHLVRHGPTHAKAIIGWTDLPADLSDHAALARLSALLPQAPVISSDLIRAADTARALAQDRPRLPADPRLREIHFGAWEGRSHAQIDAEDPAAIRAFWDSTGEARAPGGESWNDMAQRVLAAVQDLTGPPDVIVVAHFGAILDVVQRALRLEVQQVFAQRIDNLSLTEVHCAATGWTVPRINHLA